MKRTSVGILSVLLLATACAPPPSQPTPELDPCEDARYQELREQDVDDMSEREYEYFLQRDRACTEYQATKPQRDAAEATSRSLNNIWAGAIMSSLVGALAYWFAVQ